MNIRTSMANEPELIKIESAVAKGAVCLDGSPPAYQLDWGKDEGGNKWLLHLQGGYWCTTIEECRMRMNDSSGLGSSMKMGSLHFTGILSNNKELNPYFYNWNRVFVRYCDGSCFTGDKQEALVNGPYYRGGRIFYAIMDELLELGMENAYNTPVFLFNSAYDTFQVASTVWLREKSTRSCLYNLTDFRSKFLQEVTDLGNLSTRGLFINSCHTHSQSEFQSKWLGDPNSMLDNKTISEAVGEWYNDNKLTQMIDKEHIYPQQCVVDASEPYACNNYTSGASYLCNINQTKLNIPSVSPSKSRIPRG